MLVQPLGSEFNAVVNVNALATPLSVVKFYGNRLGTGSHDGVHLTRGRSGTDDVIVRSRRISKIEATGLGCTSGVAVAEVQRQ